MRKIRNIMLMMLTILSMMTLLGCNNNNGGGNITPPIVEKIDITGITFENKTVEYDGNSHSIEITGNLPEGVTVSYTNNGQTEVGQYSIIATFTDSTGKYNVPNPMSAILTIEGSKVVENSVKIKSIKANETEVAPVMAKMSSRTKLNTKSTTDDINYIIITRPQTDITFTITLDNPEAYGIDDIRITCDDPNSQIWLADGNGSGEWQKIQREADGTSVVGWDSANRYERTYNIRTTSEDAINSFKVVDVRLAGHDKFQSKETNSTDLGNNELHIYKMDEDAYTLNVIENTFDYIRFNFNIKDEYKDIISNIRVDGLEMDEELGYWMLEESREVEISYEYYLEEYGVRVCRKDSGMKIGPLSLYKPSASDIFVTDNHNYSMGYYEGYNTIATNPTLGYIRIYYKIVSNDSIVIPELTYNGIKFEFHYYRESHMGDEWSFYYEYKIPNGVIVPDTGGYIDETESIHTSINASQYRTDAIERTNYQIYIYMDDISMPYGTYNYLGEFKLNICSYNYILCYVISRDYGSIDGNLYQLVGE